MKDQKLAVTSAAPATQTERKKALQIMADRINVDPIKLLDTLKSTVFQKASDEELLALVVIANTYQLDPILKEIYAFPTKGGGIMPIVSIDGWIKMMNRQDNFDGIEFSYNPESGADKPVSCTATIWVKGRSKPIIVTEFYDECYRESDPWKRMPRRMLRHKALMQAARVAFGFSGVYDEDEAKDVVNIEATVTSTVASPKFLTAPKTASTGTTVVTEPTPRQNVGEAQQPDPKPSDDQRTPFEKIADFCKRDGVSDDQVLTFAKENKLAGPKTEETMQMTEANATKIVETWDNILPKIREIQI